LPWISLLLGLVPLAFVSKLSNLGASRNLTDTEKTFMTMRYWCEISSGIPWSFKPTVFRWNLHWLRWLLLPTVILSLSLRQHEWSSFGKCLASLEAVLRFTDVEIMNIESSCCQLSDPCN